MLTFFPKISQVSHRSDRYFYDILIFIRVDAIHKTLVKVHVKMLILNTCTFNNVCSNKINDNENSEILKRRKKAKK